MNKFYFLSLVLICIIVASSIIFSKALCEDDGPTFDTPCNTNDFLRNYELFASASFQTGLLCEQHKDVFVLKPIILFLERQEK